MDVVVAIIVRVVSARRSFRRSRRRVSMCDSGVVGRLVFVM